MKITHIPENKIDVKKFIVEFKDRLEENEQNTIENEYDEGYMEGYHDAIIEVFNFLEIKHDEDFFN